MNKPNLRKSAFFALLSLRGRPVGNYYRRMLREDQDGIPPNTTARRLAGLLAHCQRHVPYYAELMREVGGSFLEDPEEYLTRLPVITKEIIRTRLDDLKSSDLRRRKWFFNTSGGSTGEPIRFIQDLEYEAWTEAIKLLFAKLVGREVGEAEFILWGSHRDVASTTEDLRAQLRHWLSNTTIQDGFVMTPTQMRQYILLLNKVRPKLITAYADSIYELAKFAEEECLPVRPPAAIITSAVMLYPFMREKIESVFHCKVYNRYGSREVGDIACERHDQRGFWVPPWINYVEIVDSEGKRVPNGCEGDVLVTSLTNFAMPLIRYRIGDRGVLAPRESIDRKRDCQVLEEVLGRTTDMLRGKDGQLIHSGYFMVMLFFKDWIRKYQVIQKSTSRIIFRLVCTTPDHPQEELDELVAKTRLVMGDECEITFEFVDDIPASGSGKFRYVISEVTTLSR
jgi:phenylacetate-CoA ligase